MSFINEWCINICATIIIATVFSFLSPKGNTGKYLRLIIALFILVSFISPIKNIKSADFSDIMNNSFSDEYIYDCNTYENLISTQIEGLLNQEGITGSSISCKIKNSGDEIEISEIIVSLTDDYDTTEVKNMIFDNLGYSAQVKYIGQ